ncbi:MAG TPA: FAD-dependent monooxygenase [Bryobacteraceae bacterium]|nr:FAD-dependent monooxygenase [Bryobacteraceae bacterium]
MATADFPVIIVGAAPVGLTLAVGLAKHGIRSIVLEKKTRIDEHSRALVVQASTLELLNSYGMADEFMREGCFLRQINLHDVDRNAVALTMTFDEIAAETAYPGMLLLPQDRLEHLLLDRVLKTGLSDVRFGHRFVSYAERSDHVVVSLADSSEIETTISGSFLVGCDGAHSSIRRVWGESLKGNTFPIRVFLHDLQIRDSARDELAFPRFHVTHPAMAGAIRYKPFHWRLMGPIPADESEEEALSSDRVSKLVARLIGPGPFEQNWVAAFSIHARISPSFRKGRVLLAGDAAHISSPAGGQGLNSGMQDAQNLAWKLVLALEGGNTEQLLDSYNQERRPAIASFVLPATTWATRIVLTASRRRFLPIALRAARLALRNGQIRRGAGRRLAMLGTHYRKSTLIFGERKWAGRRAPGGPTPQPTIVSFGASSQTVQELERALIQLNSDHRLPTLMIRNIGESDPLWRQWRARSNLVAFVRPDGYVGWAALSPTAAETLTGVLKALGMLVAVQQDHQ